MYGLASVALFGIWVFTKEEIIMLVASGLFAIADAILSARRK